MQALCTGLYAHTIFVGLEIRGQSIFILSKKMTKPPLTPMVFWMDNLLRDKACNILLRGVSVLFVFIKEKM